MRRARNDRGLTLVELMVVVTIVAVLLGAVGFAMTREDNAGASREYARRILVALRQARNTAADYGCVVQVSFDQFGRSMLLHRLSALGPQPPPPHIWITLEDYRSGSRTHVHAIANAPHPATQGTFPAKGTGLPTGPNPGDAISFSPDGTATPATVYVSDESGLYRHKVVVFGMTGFSQHITRW